MIKKILLCVDKDQFLPFNFDQSYEAAMAALGGNSGNNVFQFALQKILNTKNQTVDIDTDFLHPDILPDQRVDYINAHYDCLVFSPANALALYAKDTNLLRWKNKISKIKVPVYAIGLGAQSDNNYSMDFTKEIKNEAKDFISSILDTGGKIGARGYFTGDVIKRLGFNESDFDVIGCPSLFIEGNKLQIVKKNVERRDFSFISNGFRAWNDHSFHENFFKYSGIFICQDEFYKLLYRPDELSWKELQYLCDYDEHFYSLYKQNRIKLYCDVVSWYFDIKNKFNFSYGCRIHGNVMSLLAGIPAFIDTFDSRVRELSEYFNIPNKAITDHNIDLYDLYMQTDYSDFNKNFAKKYNIFSNFFINNGIEINQENGFIEKHFNKDDFTLKLPNEHQKNIIAKTNYIFNTRLKELRDDISNLRHPRSVENNIQPNDAPLDIRKKSLSIAFVTHEFGLYPGHGGIASYLYNMCKYLLENTNFKVTVIACEYDGNTDLLRHKNFVMHSIKDGDLTTKRKRVLNILKDLSLDYVEFTEYLALGLDCTLEKINGTNFQNTLLVTNNHTATKECFEWSTKKQIELAPFELQLLYAQEKAQMQYSDYCFAPSTFLCNYIKKNYNLKETPIWFMNPFFSTLKTKREIKKEIENYVELEEYKNKFNISLITRFEGRKCQDRLISSFIKFREETGAKANLILAGNTSYLPDSGLDYRFELFKSIPIHLRDNIIFFDFLNIKQQEPIIAITDLIVMPSTFENQPMAMIESVLRDVPVIASKYSGCADYLENNMLFDPFNTEDLKNKIKFFYNLSAKEREHITRKQKENLQKILAPEKCILPRFSLKFPIKKTTELHMEDLYNE